MHCEFKQNVELKNYSTIRIGGKADFLFLPKNVSEIVECLQFAKKQNLPVAVLGNGSNTLCSTSGFKGVVLCTKNFNVTKFRKIKFKFSNKISFAHLIVRKSQFFFSCQF